MTTAADNAETAASLAKAIASFDRLVAAEAKKIGDKYGVTYAKAAAEQIEDKDHQIQRLEDLVRELRRQMAPLERRHDEYRRMIAALIEIRDLTMAYHDNGHVLLNADQLVRTIDKALKPAKTPDAIQADANAQPTREN